MTGDGVTLLLPGNGTAFYDQVTGSTWEGLRSLCYVGRHDESLPMKPMSKKFVYGGLSHKRTEVYEQCRRLDAKQMRRAMGCCDEPSANTKSPAPASPESFGITVTPVDRLPSNILDWPQ